MLTGVHKHYSNLGFVVSGSTIYNIMVHLWKMHANHYLWSGEVRPMGVWSFVLVLITANHYSLRSPLDRFYFNKIFIKVEKLEEHHIITNLWSTDLLFWPRLIESTDVKLASYIAQTKPPLCLTVFRAASASLFCPWHKNLWHKLFIAKLLHLVQYKQSSWWHWSSDGLTHRASERQKIWLKMQPLKTNGPLKKAVFNRTHWRESVSSRTATIWSQGLHRSTAKQTEQCVTLDEKWRKYEKHLS